MEDSDEDLRLTMSTLVVVLVPHMWCFGSRIDGHDDPTPNREVVKEKLESNADVQGSFEVRNDQLLFFSVSKNT